MVVDVEFRAERGVVRTCVSYVCVCVCVCVCYLRWFGWYFWGNGLTPSATRAHEKLRFGRRVAACIPMMLMN